MKKTTSHKLCSIYLVCLALIIVGQTVATIVKLSQTIAYQHRISNLQQKKEKLVKESENIDVALGQQTSLIALSDKTQQDFTDMNNVIVIYADQALAFGY